MLIERVTDDLVDPEIALVLDTFPTFVLSNEVLPAVREARKQMAAVEPSPDVEVVDHVVDEGRGLIVRVHRPVGVEGPLPCVYSIHGGGYVLGSRHMDDLKFQRWCPALGCIGASVEYRLAPETAYPGPLDDCYDGLAWLFEHAEELGIDPAQIGIAGISAGGGLAAGLALLIRDRSEFTVTFQLLDCPMIDDRQQTPSSRLDGLSVWSRDSNEFGWRAYLGDLYGTDDIPIYAAAARATDLSGLPPAYISVGTIDGFRDEDIDYAMRLNQAGVPTELHVYPGAPHGYHAFVDTSIAKRSGRDVTDWVARQLARTARLASR